MTLEDTELHRLQGRGDDVDSAQSGRPALTFSDNQSLCIPSCVQGGFVFLLLTPFHRSQIAFLHLPMGIS